MRRSIFFYCGLSFFCTLPLYGAGVTPPDEICRAVLKVLGSLPTLNSIPALESAAHVLQGAEGRYQGGTPPIRTLKGVSDFKASDSHYELTQHFFPFSYFDGSIAVVPVSGKLKTVFVGTNNLWGEKPNLPRFKSFYDRANDGLKSINPKGVAHRVEGSEKIKEFLTGVRNEVHALETDPSKYLGAKVTTYVGPELSSKISALRFRPMEGLFGLGNLIPVPVIKGHNFYRLLRPDYAYDAFEYAMTKYRFVAPAHLGFNTSDRIAVDFILRPLPDREEGTLDIFLHSEKPLNIHH